MLTPTLNKLTEARLPDVLVSYKKLIGKHQYIESIHTPFVRLLLPILISAKHDDRKIVDVSLPHYKPSSTVQIKAAIYDEKFYELLVYMARGKSTEKLQTRKYKFSKVQCGTLKLPVQKALIFRAGFSLKELFKISIKNFSLLRRANIPHLIVEEYFRYQQPEFSSDECRNYANIIYSLTPTNINESLISNLEIIRKTNVSFRRIYSNSAYIDNDIFKLISYSCSQKGCEIIFGQHGGGWNVYKFFNERQMVSDFATSIKYWTQNFSSNQGKLRNRLNVKLTRFSPAKLDHKRAVFIEYAWPNHRVQLVSSPQEDEVSAMYLENRIFFETTSINLEVALYPHPALNPRSRQSFYSENTGANVTFKPLQKSIYPILSKSNLVVTSVPNTVFCEALFNNYPVVLWFAPGVEIDECFHELFEELEKCSVFHRSAVSCADFINGVRLDQWWSSKSVQANIGRLRKAFLGC